MIYNGSKYNTHWNTKTLNELGEFSRGKSKHRPRNDPKLFLNGKYPLIQTGEIKSANLYVNNHNASYSEFGLNQSKLWKKGTLCITIAANIAETAIISYPMCFPDSIVGFNANTIESSELFMHYIFTYIRKSIQNSVTGSTQDNINIDYLTSLKFKVPNLSTQNKIVSVLSAIDKKIELNNKINAELETLAKTIYDYWFVQFEFPDENGKPYKSNGGKMEYNEQLKRELPEGWKAGKLQEFISRISTGLNPRDNFVLGNGNIKYVTVKNLNTDGSIDFINCDLIDEKAHQIVHARSDVTKGDLLFASIAPLGRCYFIQETPSEWDINESVFSIRPNYNKITSEFLYMFLTSDEFVYLSSNSSAGSIFKGIRIGVLSDMSFTYAGKELISKFSDTISKILRTKYDKQKENQQLTALRDWLLPMLMNGQVTIK